jgi:hypothetical protein
MRRHRLNPRVTVRGLIKINRNERESRLGCRMVGLARMILKRLRIDVKVCFGTLEDGTPNFKEIDGRRRVSASWRRGEDSNLRNP